MMMMMMMMMMTTMQVQLISWRKVCSMCFWPKYSNMWSLLRDYDDDEDDDEEEDEEEEDHYHHHHHYDHRNQRARGAYQLEEGVQHVLLAEVLEHVVVPARLAVQHHLRNLADALHHLRLRTTNQGNDNDDNYDDIGSG
jgi:ABC-type Zn2+ transport system substrate-binding protein/surface adhesin